MVHGFQCRHLILLQRPPSKSRGGWNTKERKQTFPSTIESTMLGGAIAEETFLKV
jgi:hypothetical protein